MKYIAVIVTFIFYATLLIAEEPIPKWCKDGKLIYTFEDMKPKGFSECGVLSTVKLCDASGNRIIGNVSAKGVLKDCSIGPRISVIRHDLPLEDNYDKGFAFNDETPAYKPVNSAVSPMGKVKEFEKSAQSYFDNYGRYIESLDKLIDGKEIPKGIEENFKESQKKLGESSRMLSEYLPK